MQVKETNLTNSNKTQQQLKKKKAVGNILLCITMKSMDYWVDLI